MDALTELLNGVRARSAAFCHVVLERPWALRIADDAALALITTVAGEAWILLDDDTPTLLHTGDVAIVKGPARYTIGDCPTTPPTIVVHPGDRLTTVDGNDVPAEFGAARPTISTEPQANDGAPTGAATVLASGTYRVSGDISGRLLAALPRIVRVPCADVRSPIMTLLAAEVVEDEPGQQVVLDRLLDLALVSTLRAWFSRLDSAAPGWYRAHGDSLVGPALRMIHDDPSHRWTVASLAAAAGVSRATFARRFTVVVGQPPMTYVTNWRLDRAADLMLTTDATIEAIARQVGYANAFALTVAFKRERNSTPRQHRNRAPSR